PGRVFFSRSGFARNRAVGVPGRVSGHGGLATTPSIRAAVGIRTYAAGWGVVATLPTPTGRMRPRLISRMVIAPRLARRDEKINEPLIPLYDPTGRRFVASEDPTPSDGAALLAEKEMDLK